MKLLQNFIFTVAMIVAGGCAQLGLPTASTFNQQAAVVLGSITTARQTAVTLLDEKRITVEDARNVQEQADNARAALGVARTLYATDPKAAHTKLEATAAGLRVLQTYLTTKGNSP